MQRQGFNVAGIGDLLAGVLAAGDGVYRDASLGLTVAPQTIFSWPAQAGVPYGFLVFGHLSVASTIIVSVNADITEGAQVVGLQLIANDTGAALITVSDNGAGPGVAGYNFVAGAVKGFAAFGTARKTDADGDLEISMSAGGASIATLLAGTVGYAWRLR